MLGQKEREGPIIGYKKAESRIESGRKMQEGNGGGGREGPLVGMGRRKGLRCGKRNNIISSMTRQKSQEVVG